jgi:hypothetical protein
MCRIFGVRTFICDRAIILEKEEPLGAGIDRAEMQGIAEQFVPRAGGLFA